MNISGIIWFDDVADKLEWKHHISTDEVEQVLLRKPHIEFKEKGKTNPDEDVYVALGRTEAGRHLLVAFILKSGQQVLPISARDQTRSERRYYEKAKK